ncbi:MAG: hypothetical protein AB7F99_09780 [Vicinamibacterales bacterium]
MTHQPAENPQVDHEESDINVSAILKFGAGMIVAGVIVQAVVWALLSFFDAQQQRPREFPIAEVETRMPPSPRLQTVPREDLRQLRANGQETLASYGWVDRELGIVRIPIDVAMRLVLERGLPTRDAAQPAAEATAAPVADPDGVPVP